MIVLVHAGIGDASMSGNAPLPPEGEVSDADDLEVRLGDGPVALVGASFGGQVCLEVAARRSELVSELPGVTHLHSLERPEETAALVRDFLGR